VIELHLQPSTFNLQPSTFEHVGGDKAQVQYANYRCQNTIIVWEIKK